MGARPGRRKQEVYEGGDDWYVSREVIRKLLDIPTPEQISMLAARGVLPKAKPEGYPLIACVRAYIRYLRNRADGTTGTLAELRAQIMSEKARLLELQRKEREGTLLPVEEAKHFWAGVLIACRTRLLAIPPRLRQRAPELPLELVRIVEEEIREALEELSDPDSSVHEIAQRARRKKK